MSTIELITGRAKRLPKELQREVADFADYLLQKVEHGEHERASSYERAWPEASMQSALHGFEDDPVTYSKNDIKRNGI